MKFGAKNIATSILAVAFLTACSGGRQKQSVVVEPAPGSKQPASDSNKNPGQEQQQGQPGQKQEQQPGKEQINGGGGQGQGGQPQTQVAPPSNPGSGGSGSGGSGSGTTDLTIDAVLDDGTAGGTSTPPAVTPGTSTVGTWDGKSFKGSGKWKVDPVN